MEAEIREITSIVRPSPTDTSRSDDGRIRRIEEQNLATLHAPLFKIHNGLRSSARPFNYVDAEIFRGKVCDTVIFAEWDAYSDATTYIHFQSALLLCFYKTHSSYYMIFKKKECIDYLSTA